MAEKPLCIVLPADWETQPRQRRIMKEVGILGLGVIRFLMGQIRLSPGLYIEKENFDLYAEDIGLELTKLIEIINSAVKYGAFLKDKNQLRSVDIEEDLRQWEERKRKDRERKSSGVTPPIPEVPPDSTGIQRNPRESEGVQRTLDKESLDKLSKEKEREAESTEIWGNGRADEACEIVSKAMRRYGRLKYHEAERQIPKELIPAVLRVGWHRGCGLNDFEFRQQFKAMIRELGL